MTLRLVKFEGDGPADSKIEIWINPEAVASLVASEMMDGQLGVLINLIGGTGYHVKGTIPDIIAVLEPPPPTFGGEY